MSKAVVPEDTSWSFVDELEALIPDLRAFARSLCRDHALADDLAQSACLKAWTAVDTFECGAPMKPWLFRILRNEYLQHARRAWRTSPVESEVLEETLHAPQGLDVAMDLGRIADAIYDLPDKQRDALILVLAAGLTYEEAGTVLSCSSGTVKSRVSRGREAVMTDVESGRVSASNSVAPREEMRSLRSMLSDADALISKSSGGEVPI